MSELKALVDGLRGLEQPELRSLIASRLINLVGIDDLYSLAEALNTAKSYTSVISTLSHRQLESLAKISRGEEVTANEVESLRKLLLVYQGGAELKIFEALLASLRELRAFTRPIAVISETDEVADTQTIDRQAGISLFQTIQALTEIIFDLEKFYVREVGRGNVGLPDIKRLASALSCSNEKAKSYFSLAAALGLTTIHEARHRLTAKAEIWLNSDAAERVQLLISHFRDLLGPELTAELAEIKPGTNLSQWVLVNFPFADNRGESRLGKILGLAEDLGLAVERWVTSYAGNLIAGKSAGLAEALNHLPPVQDRIVLQPDGSVIAPGPLVTKVESELRRIAETETIGLASTYRLTPLSITHALELGESGHQIRAFLSELSGKPLPQPIDYLIDDVEKRFGKLQIGSGNHEWRSQISSPDALLLTEIASDSRLKPFALHRQAPELLACRFEPSVVYFGLRECGFLAIRVDADGKVISPIATVEPMNKDAGISPIEAKLESMLLEDRKLGAGDGDEFLIRQIQLAIRNKALLKIQVRFNNDELTTFELLPNALANGRLRGKDRKAQIERTLPLSTIVELDLA